MILRDEGGKPNEHAKEADSWSNHANNFLLHNHSFYMDSRKSAIMHYVFPVMPTLRHDTALDIFTGHIRPIW
jgi:hypothetical protein